MQNLKIDGMNISVLDIAQAHAQLESDYNVGGIVRARPSNARRNMSTGCQLSRMQFTPGTRWVDIVGKSKDTDPSDDDDVRYIYMSNVLKWNLPIDAPLAKKMKSYFSKEALKPYKQRLAAAIKKSQLSL